jgi:trimethylamine-N-oxide reductase (cytochrome c)
MDPVGENVYQNGVFKDITENGDAVLFWGADPETTPWGWGGQLPSRMCYWFNEIGVKSIFICPDVNYTSAVHADKWIPVIPNTDAALQLALAYVWITEDLYDKEYIATHADGFDWFSYHVMGGDDDIPKTPQWAEGKCGVKAHTIKALARYWAKSRVSIGHCNGGGYIRSAFSHEPARLEVALLGMQGLGKPGANQFQFIEWTLFNLPSKSPVPVSEVYPSSEAVYHGFDMNTGPSFIPKTLLPKAILSPPVQWYGHTMAGYPKEDQLQHFEFPLPGDAGVRMIWSDAPCWSTCWNGGFEFEEALRSEQVECILMQHPWMENDTLFADLILPTATFMECPDLTTDNYNGQHGMLIYEEQAVDLVGEAKSEFEAVSAVALKLQQYGGIYEGLLQRYVGEKDVDEVFREGFERSGIADRITYDQFKAQRFWCSPVRDGWEDEPAGMIAFYEDPETHPIDTLTGKLEYYSTTLAGSFPDDTVRMPYPRWIEETPEHQDRITSERAKRYPFPLMSNHPRWRVHANLDDVPWLREISTCKVRGADGYAYEPVWINPLDAERYGITHGDVVKIFNERGTVLGGAKVTERIRPGVLYQDHGARIDAIVGGRRGLDRGGANNLICTPETTSPNCVGEVTNSFLVGIEKVDPFKLAEEYPEQFARSYDPATGVIPEAYLVEEEVR